MMVEKTSEGFNASSHFGPRCSSYVAQPPSSFCSERISSTASRIRARVTRFIPSFSSRSDALSPSAVQSLIGQPRRLALLHLRNVLEHLVGLDVARGALEGGAHPLALAGGDDALHRERGVPELGGVVPLHLQP